MSDMPRVRAVAHADKESLVHHHGSLCCRSIDALGLAPSRHVLNPRHTHFRSLWARGLAAGTTYEISGFVGRALGAIAP